MISLHKSVRKNIEYDFENLHIMYITLLWYTLGLRQVAEECNRGYVATSRREMKCEIIMEENRRMGDVGDGGDKRCWCVCVCVCE